MKTFYTVRDIEDMHMAGVVEIEIHDEVVLTDVAREKAIALGMKLKAVDAGAVGSTAQAAPRPVAPGSSRPRPATAAGSASGDLVATVKAAVVARLGTDKYNDLLDRIIPQVIAQLKK